jgi:hypothetical protein
MSDRQARLLRRIAARDEANRIRAKVAPTDWARMTRTQKKARLAKEARS